ncbi:stage III sporulation protein AD [Weizmannia acidilactici]|uniref:Stage III sporulation protein AD n=1 Tax=Weizmannia acidilactici TaxID=2607726 RepID=A0A5J4JBT4_9BACI|nr:stage III sporulation protein AD [Weizmannia acidilactici]GER66143.1 stage III sporulation protein AD [Weizmannia acidilactici]GER69221.1 stage III sporulation protein AD [Weizmannia acidilactici]GER72452.1 stage III sporulation protein AD [Weizmannia acidilactici]
MLQIAGIALITTFLALILKEQKPNFAFLLTLFAGCFIFLFLMDKIYDIIRLLQKIAQKGNVDTMYIETILKIIGIAYIADFAANITKDAGQGAMAAKVEVAGKIIILTMAIPIITVLIETIVNLVPKG